MKKIMIFVAAAMVCCMVAAQPRSVRIGNMLLSVNKVNGDTLTSVEMMTPCPPCPTMDPLTIEAKKGRAVLTVANINRYDCYAVAGFGVVAPNYGDDIYPLSGSFSLMLGGEYSFRPIKPLAFIGGLYFSHANYKINKIGDYQEFTDIIGTLERNKIRKEPFRTNNIAAAFYLRLYPASKFFIDLGVQGDWAFRKRLVVKYQSGGRDKFKDNYSFLPLYPSAVARIGWKDFAVFARYRFTEALNPKVFTNDLPPLTIGVMLL